MSIEKNLGEDDFIVSKTDLKGVITYGNRIFTEISGYREGELVGSHHNILRHPDMPRVIFKLLWSKIQKREEIFAFVKNRCKDGEFYWVFANVTASLNSTRERIKGYYSVRRKPNPKAIEEIEKIYAKLLKIEKESGLKESEIFLNNFLKDRNLEYDEYIISLQASG